MKAVAPEAHDAEPNIERELEAANGAEHARDERLRDAEPYARHRAAVLLVDLARRTTFEGFAKSVLPLRASLAGAWRVCVAVPGGVRAYLLDVGRGRSAT